MPRLVLASVDDLEPGAWRWPHFNPRTEWACKGTGRIIIVPEFMGKLERLRAVFGKPLPVTSGYRSPEHNRVVSSTGLTGPHTTGRAADIAIFGADALRLLDAALEQLDFTGIGLKQHGPLAGRFIHFDDLEDAPGRPRPTIWTY